MSAKETLGEMIFATLDWDKHRASYDIDAMLRVFRLAGLVGLYGNRGSYTELEARIVIAELVQSGRLWIGPGGQLQLPPEMKDPSIEYFRGAWFVTQGREIGGPFTESEAHDYVRKNLSVQAGRSTLHSCEARDAGSDSSLREGMGIELRLQPSIESGPNAHPGVD